MDDLLRSPYMLLHPPVLFLGFALMTVPFAFAMTALWKKRYDGWVKPAMGWTLAADLFLFGALFLGGYWAYVTLSFGGFWAWDPVENASLVPWIFGVAGLHMMLIHRRSGAARKSAILFMILAFSAVVYESFLTRSGILGDSSVHSFTDLGLYNQLVLFILTILLLGIGMFAYRYRDLQKGRSLTVSLLNREFLVFSGSFLLLVTGFIILLGTSSPLIGKIFVSSPTPPAKSFYDNWTMPFVILIALATVLGQYQWRKRYDAESLSSALLGPLLVTSILTMVTIVLGRITNIEHMIYLFVGYLAVIGNGIILVQLLRTHPKRIGGSLTHVGFAILLLGILSSSAYQTILLTPDTLAYNEAVKQGNVKEKDGTPVLNTINFFELKRNKPKSIGKGLIATFEGVRLSNGDHPAEQVYKLRFRYADDSARTFTMTPIVYPMMEHSTAKEIHWAVNPEVRIGFFKDIWLYVGNSSYVEEINREARASGTLQPVADVILDPNRVLSVHELTFHRGDTLSLGDYRFHFVNFEKAGPDEAPKGAMVAVKAVLEITDQATGRRHVVKPLFAVVDQKGEKLTYTPPLTIADWGMDVQFSYVKAMSNEIKIRVRGVRARVKKEGAWVVVVAEEKPFISLVWIGVFVMMGGFVVSIAARRKKKHSTKQG